MKESEFIDLLNLYVDHEISPQDSARLEAEVAGSPHRRRTYREYCMMHKACGVLAAQYRDAEAEAPRFVTESKTSATGWGWSAKLFAGGVMAAACLALAFVVHMRHAVSTGASMQVTAPAQVAATDLPNFPRAIPAHLTTDDLQPVLNTRDWTNPTVKSNPSLVWMNQVELAPIQRTALEQLPIFKAAPLLLSSGSAATQVAAPAQDEQIERVAFQFQR